MNNFINDWNFLPKPLSKEELKGLFIEAGNGSRTARKKLIISNMRLVLCEVRGKFSNIDYDKNDLVSIGTIGLIKAIDSYNINKSYEFSTYAVRCIDNEILMLVRKLKRSNNDSINRVILSSKEDCCYKIEDIIASDFDMNEYVDSLEKYQYIDYLIDNLKDRDREIIKLYFGFYNNKLYNQKEIAEIYNIDQSTISKIISRVLKKLKKELLFYDNDEIKRYIK